MKMAEDNEENYEKIKEENDSDGQKENQSKNEILQKIKGNQNYSSMQDGLNEKKQESLLEDEEKEKDKIIKIENENESEEEDYFKEKKNLLHLKRILT